MGTSNISPLVEAPDLTNFPLCNSYDGIVPGGATMSFDCAAIGRYFIIQTDVQVLELVLCEVKVFTAK